MKKYWQGKSVVITGASSGLGWAITEALAPYQIKFGLLSRRLEKMKALAENLEDKGSSFWFRSCDVRDRNQVETAIHDFHDHAGTLDVVWVNSGIGGETSFAGWDWKRYENVLNTNLQGAIYTIIPSLNIMKSQGHGTIVGIGSAASMRGMPEHVMYSMTKIGLHYFLESMAIELPEIQFTMIHPGYVDTPLNRGATGRIWLMQPEKAAQIMIKAVSKKKRIFIYPLPMRITYSLIRHLPISMYVWLARKAVD